MSARQTVLWVLTTKKTVQTISVVRSVKRAAISRIHLSQGRYLRLRNPSLYTMKQYLRSTTMPYSYFMLKKNTLRNDLGWQDLRHDLQGPKKSTVAAHAEVLSLSTLLISSTCADASLKFGLMLWYNLLGFLSAGYQLSGNSIQIPGQTRLWDSMNYQMGIHFQLTSNSIYWRTVMVIFASKFLAERKRAEDWSKEHVFEKQSPM